MAAIFYLYFFSIHHICKHPLSIYADALLRSHFFSSLEPVFSQRFLPML